MPYTREQIAERCAREIPPGSIVNVGIGLPTLVPGYLPPDHDVWLHSENGLLGMGPYPWEGEEDPQLINAGKETVTVVAGGSCFDSAASFGMIRGGHIDMVLLGAMQVSCAGDLANWSVPAGKTMGIGGAMDLASGVDRIIVLMNHVTNKGEPKLVAECSYPLTARRCVQRIITDLGVFDCAGNGFVVVELAPDVTLSHVQGSTGATVFGPSS